MGFFYRGHFFTPAGRHVPGYVCHTHKDGQGRKISTSFAEKDNPCRLAIQAWHAHNALRRAHQTCRENPTPENKERHEHALARETEALQKLEKRS